MDTHSVTVGNKRAGLSDPGESEVKLLVSVTEKNSVERGTCSSEQQRVSSDEGV